MATRVVTLFLLLSTMMMLMSGCGFGTPPFTGIFVGDNRLHELVLANLIQADKTVTGNLTLVKPDGQGGTRSEVWSVSGTVEGRSASLTSSVLFTSVTIMGRREGQQLVLDFPAQSGQLRSLSMSSTTREQFNQTVQAWSGDLAEHHRQEAMRKADADALQSRANELSRAIGAVRQDTARLDQLTGAAQTAIAGERSVLHELEQELIEVKQEAAKRPMERYQACQVVRYAYEQTMGYTFRSSLDYHRARFAESSGQIRQLLGQVQSRSDAARMLSRSVAELTPRVVPPPRLAANAGDEEAPLSALASKASATQKELTVLEAAHGAMFDRASALMAEGKSSLDGAVGQVKC